MYRSLVSAAKFSLFCTCLWAQPLATNTGEVLFLQPGGIIWCEGGWLNQNGGRFLNQGTVYIAGDIENHDPQQLFPPTPIAGTLVLNGAQQTLRGSAPIRTDILKLEGTAAKVLETDLYIDSQLDLGNAELRTQNRFAAVRNPDPTAITRLNGFVSSEVGGYLERATDRVAAYLFPVGGHTPLRYRPVEIIPSGATPHRFAVRMANVDPTIEGRARDQLHPELCDINPLYYHYVERLSGAAPAEIRLYYEPTDPIRGPLAQWRNVLWHPTPAQPIPRGWALLGWSDYSDPYFAFSERRANLTLSASADTVEVNQPIYFTATGGAPTYEWNFGDGTVRSSSDSQVHSYDSPGEYTVAVTTSDKCTDTAFMRIVVVAPFALYIPTAFSPNGDGVNEEWQPVIRGTAKTLRWRIYDRWGLLIATGEGPTARWDGTKGGKPCAEGAYVYIIEAETLTGEKVQKSGTLTLLR
ncbi:MAG: gliding motility-associated C-terminal domain-containing protein [Bacteroidia bacterium]|nr:gliding motility-associated C-terminal domain-containing protein [Bacteroidia bacterium]